MKLPSFGRKTLANTSDITDAIAKHDALLASARETSAGIEAERADALLYADDTAVDRIDARAREAALTVQRLEARKTALEVQLREVAHSEEMAGLDRRRAEAQAARDAARVWRTKTYPRLARELVAGLQAIEAAEAEVKATNKAFAEACHPDAQLERVEPLQEMRDGIMAPVPSVAKLTRLVELPGVAPGYGKIVEAELWAAGLGL